MPTRGPGTNAPGGGWRPCSDDRITTPTPIDKVVEFAATLPYRLKLSGRQTKRLLRHAMNGLLDPALLERPKTAFRVPVREWLRGVLSPLVQETFRSRVMRGRGLFEPAALDFLAASAGGKQPGAPPSAIWNVLWLELWCAQYLDANPAADR